MTAGQKIFERRFNVRVPMVSLYSKEEMELFGIPLSSVNGEVVKDSHGEMSLVSLTINELVDIYSNGNPIRVVNHDDAKEIYNIIEEHINTWKNQLHSSPNLPDYPEDDLIALDGLANSIFTLNKGMIVDSVMAGQQNGYGNSGFTLMDAVKKAPPAAINYSKMKRTNNLVDGKNRKKYNLNDLLSNI